MHLIETLFEGLLAGLGLGFIIMIFRGLFLRLKFAISGYNFGNKKHLKRFFRKFDKRDQLFIDDSEFSFMGAAGDSPVEGPIFYVDNPEQMALDVLSYLEKKGDGGTIWSEISDCLVVAHVDQGRRYWPCLKFEERKAV